MTMVVLRYEMGFAHTVMQRVVFMDAGGAVKDTARARAFCQR
jgi:ABC-type polar amino acid transport system ATPase subunit